MSVTAAGFARLLLVSEFEIGTEDGSAPWWLFSGEAGAARDLLSSLLSGMITMTSLMVSITMVVLSLAAGQLGARVIGNFLRDRQIQLVFGLFMGTILYIVVILRSITEANDTPDIAVTVASALTMLSLFALLLYVHKIARSIIADTVIKSIADDLEQALEARPEKAAQPFCSAPMIGSAQPAAPVCLAHSGFIQVIDYDRLLEIASKENLLIRVNVRAGHFVLHGGNHLEILGSGPPPDEVVSDLREAVVIGAERTPTQDLEFSIRQLVEIAVRALSAGINDPFTAIQVVNRLGAALEKASGRASLPSHYRDPSGVLRLIATTSDFSGLLDASLNQIRQAAGGNAAVLIHIVRTIGQLARTIDDGRHRARLLDHLAKLERSAQRTIPDPTDLEDFSEAALTARRHRVAGPT
jgi:uncharacterized membrane protein